jgi:cyclopropane fatty-acyl-phospholipid synthase-like methyltransferase
MSIYTILHVLSNGQKTNMFNEQDHSAYKPERFVNAQTTGEKMSERTLKPEDQMMQWITSKWIAKPIHIAAELGIADLLRDKPMNVKELAQRTETHAPTLYRLLRALSAVGIFAELDEQIFELTPLAKCLRSEAMRPLALMFLSDWHNKAWEGLAYSVRSGNPGFDHVFGKKAFDWLEENPEARAILDQGQGIKALGFAKAVMKAYDFSDLKTICDIGGGRGAFLKELLAAYPHLKGIVSDLPGAVPAAQQMIAEAGLQDRCTAIPCDFFKEAPPLCDAYLLVNILHDWEDETCRLILENLARVMNTGSRLLIVEYLIEPGQEFSVAKLLDIEVLVMGGGRERTVEEYKALLSSAGIKLTTTLSTNGGIALLECIAG